MDMKSLVEKITRDVMETIKEKETAGGGEVFQQKNAFKPPSAGKKAVLLLDENIDGVVDWGAFFSRRLSGLDVSLLLCNPEGVTVEGSLKGNVREVISYSRDKTMCNYFSGVDSLFYIVSKPFQLAAVSNLFDDRPCVRLILEALTRGIKVVFLEALKRGGNTWDHRLDCLIKEVCSMGVIVEKFNAIVLKGSSSQSISASSGSSYSAGNDKASSKCEGDKEECLGCGQCTSLVPGKVGAVVDAGASRISSSPGAKAVNSELASYIDHTLLKAEATREEVIKLCNEARQYVFASVCINPAFVKLASECLQGSPVKVCTVIGFPLGATTSVTKAIETRDAIANGAGEIDMVINVGALKAGNYDVVEKDIEAVIEAANGKIVKVIIEAALLTDEEKVIACKLSKKAGADFVKTSTGFGPGGATAKDVALMRQTVGKYMGVKASGGIRDIKTAQEMINAGATRIGASASVAIVKGEKSDSKY